MIAVGTTSGWTLYEHEGHYFIRYEQAVGSLARSEPSVAKALLDHILRREASNSEDAAT